MNPKQERLLIVLGSIIAVLLIVLIVILLGEDDGSPTAATTSFPGAMATSIPESPGDEPTSTAPPTTSAPATTAAPPTTAAATTTAAPPTSAPAGTCTGLPSATPPAPGPGVTSAIGDFDGDGDPDQLLGYQDGGGTAWVQMVLSYGYATETAVPGPVTALGAQNFGGGARDVAFAYVDSGASVLLVGFFFAPGCDVFEATITGTGSVARFPVGGGVMHLDGLTCTADGFIATSATTGDGITWEYSTTRYVWNSGPLEFQPVTSSIALLASPADDDTIFSAADFNCPA